ncbi:MAG: hypothetical protein ABGX83_04170 [Nitrospira sp.]|nr:hypothetical protein [Candidatus Manganitrophaceae bacterium]HIL34719.1 hypothetical protein [Candidatus Manganitrophaceae bacterium]
MNNKVGIKGPDPINTPVHFTIEEHALIQDTHFFETKATVSQKVKTLLLQLHFELKEELREISFLAPREFDPENYQFVKGEHLQGFPYLYLDFPKFFKGQEKLTFRTLFWWGHFFVFSLILEGEYLHQYKRNLLDHYIALANQGLFILMTDTLWEWRLDSNTLLEIRKDNKKEVSAALENRPFLKIHRYLVFDHPALKEGTVIEEALQTFRLMSLLVKAPVGKTGS